MTSYLEPVLVLYREACASKVLVTEGFVSCTFVRRSDVNVDVNVDVDVDVDFRVVVNLPRQISGHLQAFSGPHLLRRYKLLFFESGQGRVLSLTAQLSPKRSIASQSL